MKRILITGGAGFIGHHFIEAVLKNTDWRIMSLDRLSISGNLNRLSDIEIWDKEKYRVELIHHDLRSPINDFVSAKIGLIDYVIHMAASSHVDRSIQYPMEFVLDNIVGTVNMLDWFKKRRQEVSGYFKRFLYFGTDEVYGSIDKGEWVEGSRHNPSNPYAATKAGAEDMCRAYANTYGLPIQITNTMNVLGERQHPEKFLPLVIRKIYKGEKVTIHANKDRTKAGSRFYIHARNVADAVLFLLNNVEEFLDKDDVSKGQFNIVGEKEVDNLELAQMVAKIMGKELKYEMVDFHSSRPGHDLRYGLDGSKMKKLGWEPPKKIDEWLPKTVNWYLKNKQWLNL